MISESRFEAITEEFSLEVNGGSTSGILSKISIGFAVVALGIATAPIELPTIAVGLAVLCAEDAIFTGIGYGITSAYGE